MKIKVDRGEYEIEYDLSSLIIRLIFLFLILFVIVGSINNILDSKKSEKEFEDALNFDPSQDYESLIVKRNSRGSFYSLKENVLAEGTMEILHEEDGDYVLLKSDFKVSNNPNLYLVLATTPTGKAQIRIAKLLGSVGRQQYLIESNVDFMIHKYVVIIDSTTNEALAYAIIE